MVNKISMRKKFKNFKSTNYYYQCRIKVMFFSFHVMYEVFFITIAVKTCNFTRNVMNPGIIKIERE